MSSKFQQGKHAAEHEYWGSYRDKNGNGPLTHRPIRQLETDHLLNILRTQSQVWGNWFGTGSNTLNAIVFILMVERNMDQLEIKQRMEELDEIESQSRYPSVWKWEDVKKETDYYVDFFAKRWRNYMQNKTRRFTRKDTKQCS